MDRVKVTLKITCEIIFNLAPDPKPKQDCEFRCDTIPLHRVARTRQPIFSHYCAQTYWGGEQGTEEHWQPTNHHHVQVSLVTYVTILGHEVQWNLSKADTIGTMLPVYSQRLSVHLHCYFCCNKHQSLKSWRAIFKWGTQVFSCFIMFCNCDLLQHLLYKVARCLHCLGIVHRSEWGIVGTFVYCIVRVCNWRVSFLSRYKGIMPFVLSPAVTAWAALGRSSASMPNLSGWNQRGWWTSSSLWNPHASTVHPSSLRR